MFQKKYIFLIKSNFFPNQKWFVLPLKIHATQHDEEHNEIFFPKSEKSCWLSFPYFWRKFAILTAKERNALYSNNKKFSLTWNISVWCLKIFLYLFIYLWEFIWIKSRLNIRTKTLKTLYYVKFRQNNILSKSANWEIPPYVDKI